MASILIVDDEAGIRASLKGALGREGHGVDDAADLDAARRLLRDSYDVVLLDVAFPGGNGLDLLAEITRDAPETTVIMMSGHASIETAVRATRLGAFDFMEKPVSLERLIVLLRNATQARTLAAENRRLRSPWAAPLVGDSPAMRQVLEAVERIAATRSSVLLQGETGTGKELVARAIHHASPRRDGPFVAVNCAAIPEDLIESEMFGHERGAFTGATQARIGCFEQAQRGTLLLDEVNHLSERAQVKLLRVIQEMRLTRVGGQREIAADVRLVSACNRDLMAEAQAGRFHLDLAFRIAVVPITLPPLRERREDIPALARLFAARLATEHGRAVPVLGDDALAELARYAYPGNVRELMHLIARLVILTPGPRITSEHVRAALPAAAAGPIGVPPPLPQPLAEAVEAFERRHIAAAIAAEGGHMTRAAARLGLERSHLYKKMRQLGMRAED